MRRLCLFFFSSRRRHTRYWRDWSSDVCSSDLLSGMTRLIGGLAGGRRLTVPPSGVRPTGDRAREGLFNSLGTLVALEGAAVLDLYAGSGTLGLEALDRKSTRLNSSHANISYAVFCLK